MDHLVAATQSLPTAKAATLTWCLNVHAKSAHRTCQYHCSTFLVQAEFEGCEALRDCQHQPVGAARGAVHNQKSDPGCTVTVLHRFAAKHSQAPSYASLTNQDCTSCQILFVPGCWMISIMVPCTWYQIQGHTSAPALAMGVALEALRLVATHARRSVFQKRASIPLLCVCLCVEVCFCSSMQWRICVRPAWKFPHCDNIVFVV